LWAPPRQGVQARRSPVTGTRYPPSHAPGAGPPPWRPGPSRPAGSVQQEIIWSGVAGLERKDQGQEREGYGSKRMPRGAIKFQPTHAKIYHGHVDAGTSLRRPINRAIASAQGRMPPRLAFQASGARSRPGRAGVPGAGQTSVPPRLGRSGPRSGRDRVAGWRRVPAEPGSPASGSVGFPVAPSRGSRL